jgi:hypothetical protein
MNAINLIVPYRYDGMWVFDDARVGLDKEPFVSGADTMIDLVVNDIPNAQNGFRLLFCETCAGFNKIMAELAKDAYQFLCHFLSGLLVQPGSPAFQCSRFSRRGRPELLLSPETFRFRLRTLVFRDLLRFRDLWNHKDLGVASGGARSREPSTPRAGLYRVRPQS